MVNFGRFEIGDSDVPRFYEPARVALRRDVGVKKAKSFFETSPEPPELVALEEKGVVVGQNGTATVAGQWFCFAKKLFDLVLAARVADGAEVQDTRVGDSEVDFVILRINGDAADAHPVGIGFAGVLEVAGSDDELVRFFAVADFVFGSPIQNIFFGKREQSFSIGLDT